MLLICFEPFPLFILFGTIWAVTTKIMIFIIFVHISFPVCFEREQKLWFSWFLLFVVTLVVEKVLDLVCFCLWNFGTNKNHEFHNFCFHILFACHNKNYGLQNFVVKLYLIFTSWTKIKNFIIFVVPSLFLTLCLFDSNLLFKHLELIWWLKYRQRSQKLIVMYRRVPLIMILLIYPNPIPQRNCYNKRKISCRYFWPLFGLLNKIRTQTLQWP